MAEIPPFDPNLPFEPVTGDAGPPPFDPNLPFERADKSTGDILTSAITDIPSEVGNELSHGWKKAAAAFNPLSPENRKIVEEDVKRGSGLGNFFNPTSSLEKGKLLASGVAGLGEMAGSWLTGP